MFRPVNIKKAALAKDGFLGNMTGQSGRERSSAAAGTFGVRVIESEAAVIEATHKVNFHTKQVNGMSLVHDYVDTIDFIPVVGILRLVETKHIGKAGAATTLDTYAEAIVGWNILFATDLHQLVGCLLCDSHGSCNSNAFYIHYYVHIH